MPPFPGPDGIPGGPMDYAQFRATYPHWMDIARAEKGVKTADGDETTARVKEYQRFNPDLFDEIKKQGYYNGDETAWCSAFVNWVMKQAGHPRTNHWGARSWLKWGRPLPKDKPRYGAVTVLTRGKNPKNGHVGFYVGMKGNRIVLLGGNQGGQHSVCESSYEKERLLGYRWPLVHVGVAPGLGLDPYFR